MQLPIWMPGLGHVNMYGLVDDRGLTVVDPGLPGPKSWRALKARLKPAGYGVKDIHTVVVTHSHPRTTSAAPGRIKKEAGAELITHKAFTTWSLDRRARARSPKPRPSGSSRRRSTRRTATPGRRSKSSEQLRR